MPTPCSPVQVPPSDSARATMRSFSASASACTRDRRGRPSWRDGSCRRQHGPRSARRGRWPRCPSASRGCIRPVLRSARRRRSPTCPSRARAPWRPRARRDGPATSWCAPRPARPGEAAAAVLAGQRLHHLRLFLAPASVPWNSRQQGASSAGRASNIGSVRRPCRSSISSMRATGMPDWMVWITVLTAPSSESKAQVAETIDSGMPYRRTVISVMMPKCLRSPRTASRGRSPRSTCARAGRAASGGRRPSRPAATARSRASCRSARRWCPRRACWSCRRSRRRRRDRSGRRARSRGCTR